MLLFADVLFGVFLGMAGGFQGLCGCDCVERLGYGHWKVEVTYLGGAVSGLVAGGVGLDFASPGIFNVRDAF
jgi:hypothetical protein